jgi:hypothetical protein
MRTTPPFMTGAGPRDRRGLSSLGFGVALSLLAAPASAQFEEQPYHGGPLPPNTHLEVRRHERLARDAALTMAGMWVVNMFAAQIGDLVCNGCTDHSYDWLYLPLAGPAIAAAMPGVQQASDAWPVILVADSALQVGAGLVALVAYLLPPRHVIVPNVGFSWTLTPGTPRAPFGLTFTLTEL